MFRRGSSSYSSSLANAVPIRARHRFSPTVVVLAGLPFMTSDTSAMTQHRGWRNIGDGIHPGYGTNFCFIAKLFIYRLSGICNSPETPPQEFVASIPVSVPHSCLQSGSLSGHHYERVTRRALFCLPCVRRGDSKKSFWSDHSIRPSRSRAPTGISR